MFEENFAKLLTSIITSNDDDLKRAIEGIKAVEETGQTFRLNTINYNNLMNALDSRQGLYEFRDYSSIMYIKDLVGNYLIKHLNEAIDRGNTEKVLRILKDEYLRINSKELQGKIDKHLLDKLTKIPVDKAPSLFSGILENDSLRLRIDKENYNVLKDKVQALGGDYPAELRKKILDYRV